MNRIVYLDGGMGTLLQAAGLPAGKDPCDWNIENPGAIAAVHRAYAEAGSDIVLTNTFGANRLKYHGDHPLGEVIAHALAVARSVSSASPADSRPSSLRIALDIGPTGRLLKPAGDLGFEDAVAAFRETISLAFAPAAAGPDLVFIETMGDLYELKAAVVAAKEAAPGVPVYCTVALQEDGKLLTGGSVEAFAALMEAMGVDAYGFNCGLGPDRMLPFVRRLAAVSTKPMIVKPNAGMPRLVDGKTVFDVGPGEFAANAAELVKAGASIVGGCCGTRPEYIQAVKAVLPEEAVNRPGAGHGGTVVSSGTSVVELKTGEGLVIGERINPTGKKLLKEAYAKGDTAYVLREAVKQVSAGAEVLDVNCGVPGLDEAALLEATVRNVQSVAICPIQVDTADPAALERALRTVNGKALVNSVNGKRESMDAVFPIVKKYGGTIVGLCLDESGIPPTADGRLAIARRILDEGAKYGFGRKDFVFDALTLSVSTDVTAAKTTLETVRRLTEELGVHTVLGVSNVSFGLPNRPALNNAMYALAKRAGLSAAIANPALIRDEIAAGAEDVLMGGDPGCANWIACNQNVAPIGTGGSEDDLRTFVARGLREDAGRKAQELLEHGTDPMEVVNAAIVPALEEVGKGFEAGKVFLPQLLMAADAAGEAFAAVRKRLAGTAGARAPGSTVVLATVKGDIHDIGKNIVRALLENYGFDVVDLGRDVPPEKIVEAVRRTGAKLVGLSALMTTTVGAMAETIRQLKASGLGARTVVGGAVVTQEFADSIGADFYARDAMRTVRIAEELKNENT